MEGELGPCYASAFDGITLPAHHGETEITGPITEPSHMQGLLERIAGLELTLQSLTPLDTENVEADAQRAQFRRPLATRSERASQVRSNGSGTARREVAQLPGATPDQLEERSHDRL